MTQDTAEIDHILSTLGERGGGQYDGEAVTQLQHALQAATLAEAEGAPASLVAAALLHDFGHLVHGLGDDPAAHDIDDRHEYAALAILEAHFPSDVTEPVRLHVEAKRYLCAAEPGYFERLSPASIRSLALQGGAMSADEVAAFAAGPHAAAAVRLRRWDEQAKRKDFPTPDLAHFRAALAASRCG